MSESNSLTFKVGSLLIPLLPILYFGIQFFNSAKTYSAAVPQPTPIVQESNLSDLFPPTVRYWATKIDQWADEYDLTADLVATLMTIESCGNPEAVSSAGALGLFQVMPYHFKEGEDPFDPDTNARAGLSYLVDSISAHNGYTKNGLAGYNAGIGGSFQEVLPRETTIYIKYGMGILEDVRLGKSESDIFTEWMRKGGQQFCNKAESTLDDYLSP